MWNHISMKLWICLVIHLSITAAVKPYPLTNVSKYKRSIGFGISNPIFSRVFNPHDDRPLAAKFFGSDYGTYYSTNIRHSQYHYDTWNDDSRSDDNSDFGTNGWETEPHFYKYREWKNSVGNSKSQVEPSYGIISKNSKNTHTTEKAQVIKGAPKAEHIFKLLPLYDIKKSFRTSTEIKKLHKNENFVKLKNNMPVKTSPMEYIFNLLPRYEILNVFRNSTPSPMIARGSEIITKNANYIPLKIVHNPIVSGSLDWPIETVVQSDLNNEPKSYLPKTSIERIFKGDPKELNLFDSKPSISFQVSENKTIAPFHEDRAHHIESKLDTIPNSADPERGDISENPHQTIEESTQPVEIEKNMLPENSQHVSNNTHPLQISSTYIPHRTKNLKSYSQFLSLPAVVIYQQFKNKNTPAIPGESINKSYKFKEASWRLLNVNPKPNDSNFETLKDSFLSNAVKKNIQIDKTGPSTQRTSVELTSTTKSIMNISANISTTNVSIPVAPRFQSYLHSNKVNVKKFVIDENSFEKIENSINYNSTNSGTTFNSTIPKNQLQIHKSSVFLSNDRAANIRNKFKPNIRNPIEQVVTLPVKKSSGKYVQYISRPITVKPIRGDMPEIIPLLPEYMINDKSDFVHRSAPEHEILFTVPKFESDRRRKLKQSSLLSPTNSDDSKHLKVHHVQRKPPTFLNFKLAELSSTRDRDSDVQTLPHADSGLPRTLSIKEEPTSIPHKRLRFDTKRLPTDKTINFRGLPYYDNKGINFNSTEVHQIVDNEKKIITK